MLTERDLIAFVAGGRAGAPVHAGDLGIGDDAAVIRVGRRTLLVTLDLMVEGVHFDLRYTPSYFLGRKAVASCLSDIAAMGGTPRALFVSAALPRRRRAAFARGMLEGIHEEAREAGAAVLGGDTSASPGPVFLDVAAVGEARPPGAPVLRSGARTGDRIYLSGTIGGSARGRQLLREGFRPWSSRLWLKDLPASDRGADRRRDDLMATLAHLLPRPRLVLGRTLARRRIASAMIDVSDGLSTDLHNLCEASRVGAEIEQERLPVHPAIRGAADRRLRRAMSGGEDYELLFTVPAKAETPLARAVRGLDVAITRIGRILPLRQGVRLVSADGKTRPLPRTGYEHFRSRADG